MYEGIQSTYTHVLYILTTGQLLQVTLNKPLVYIHVIIIALIIIALTVSLRV